ncbi:MAG: glycerophosphoryl diester phosphodiesterase [Alteromonadaceae bacterium]|jgi:glycerophosphoryl diester phosphodiesterase
MKVIAHRGASGEYPENTLLAFSEAIKQLADGIELDIQYHYSNNFVLLHDNDLQKTTNGKGSVNDYSLGDLQQLDAGLGEFIPTLHQALELINGDCFVNIEVKTAVIDKASLLKIITLLQRDVAHAINFHDFSWHQFIVSSFNHQLLAELKTLFPKLATATLVALCPLNYAQCAQQLKAISLNPSIEIVNQQLVDDAHQRGLNVWVYTVDIKEDIKKCLSYGVDGVFTNYPKQTKHYIEQLQTR